MFVAYQDMGGALCLKQLDDRDNVGAGIHKVGGSQKRFVDPGQCQGLQLVLVFARRQGAELVAKV